MESVENKSEEDTGNKSVLDEVAPDMNSGNIENEEQKVNKENNRIPSEEGTGNKSVLEKEEPDNDCDESKSKEEKFREEKRKKDEEIKEKLKKKKEAEERRKEREKKEVEFQYFVDFGSIGIIGIVFFATCLTGLVNNVSPKELSVRAIISVLFASVVVYVFRGIVKRNFCNDNNKEDKGADQ